MTEKNTLVGAEQKHAGHQALRKQPTDPRGGREDTQESKVSGRAQAREQVGLFFNI